MDRAGTNALRRTARTQSAAAIALAATVATVCAGLGAIANCDALIDAFDRVIDRRYAQTKGVPWNHGPFIDLEDRLLLDELANDDYSKGGVYLVGASNLKWATRLWGLPQSQRSLIHNYSIGASSHTGQFQFLRYLVEEGSLLSAGGKNTLIVLGASYQCTAFSCEPESFWVKLWQRRGLFSCSPEHGIHRVTRSAPSRFLRVERARVAGVAEKAKKCLLVCCERLVRGAPPARQHDPDQYCRVFTRLMGPNWKAVIAKETDQLARALDYLHEREVRVVVVALPNGSWQNRLPFTEEYNKRVKAVCASREVEFLDWRRMLSDEDFGDSTHLNLPGITKLQPAFVQLSLRHLSETGALPALAAVP